MELSQVEKQKTEREIAKQNKKRGIFRLISILALISSPWIVAPIFYIFLI